MIDALLAGLRRHLGADAATPIDLEPLDDADISAVRLAKIWEGRAVFIVFRAGMSTPWLVIKHDRSARYQRRLASEHTALRALHDRPEVAGSIPSPVALFEACGGLALAQTALPGRPLTVAIRRPLRPARASGRADHRRVLRWLGALQRSTPATQRSTITLDPQDAFDAVQRTLPDAASSRALLDRVRADGRALGTIELPLLSGHGDLGPTNVLLHRRAVGVVDWEGGVGVRPPLTDVALFLLFYARAVVGRSQRDWPTVMSAALVDDGWLSRLTWQSWAAQLRRFGLPAETGEYLLAITLAGFMAGHGDEAHEHRGSREWSSRLRAYAHARSTQAPSG